jgi:hypothetical protein
MMRRILTDFARSRNYQKRGEAALHVCLDEALAVSKERKQKLWLSMRPWSHWRRWTLERARWWSSASLVD